MASDPALVTRVTGLLAGTAGQSVFASLPERVNIQVSPDSSRNYWEKESNTIFLSTTQTDEQLRQVIVHEISHVFFQAEFDLIWDAAIELNDQEMAIAIYTYREAIAVADNLITFPPSSYEGYHYVTNQQAKDAWNVASLIAGGTGGAQFRSILAMTLVGMIKSNTNVYNQMRMNVVTAMLNIPPVNVMPIEVPPPPTPIPPSTGGGGDDPGSGGDDPDPGLYNEAYSTRELVYEDQYTRTYLITSYNLYGTVLRTQTETVHLSDPTPVPESSGTTNSVNLSVSLTDLANQQTDGTATTKIIKPVPKPTVIPMSAPDKLATASSLLTHAMSQFSAHTVGSANSSMSQINQLGLLLQPTLSTEEPQHLSI